MKPWRSRMAVGVISLAAILGGYFGGGALLQQVQFARAAGDVEATREQLSTVQDLSTVFRHVGKVIEPSVVNITVHKIEHGAAGQDTPNDQLRKFFHDRNMPFQIPDNNGNDEGDQDQDQDQEQIGTGSGVIMEVADGYGYILTNNHVAGGATEMDITLADGRVIKNGKLLGADAKSDLAVVQVKADRLIAAKWGNSDELEKGDWILAFGSPFGYIGSMTHGIVSAINRHDVGILGNNGYENFIQVDAPINPGNSGGPLVNIHGDVVGINTAIATRSGGFQGIGFAIPISEAHPIYDQIKAHGKVVRGWLGVSIKDVTEDPNTAKYFGYQGSTGVLVEEAVPNTPASDKLYKGDVIVAFNGEAIDNVQQLRNIVAATAPNTKVTIKVVRDGKEQNVQLTIGNQPDDVTAMLGHGGQAPEAPKETKPTQTLGMTLQTLDNDMAAKLQLPDVKGGAVITDIARNSVAAKSGLMTGDVITEIGKTPVHTAQEAVDALNKADLKKGIPVYVVTADGSRFVFVQSDDTGK